MDHVLAGLVLALGLAGCTSNRSKLDSIEKTVTPVSPPGAPSTTTRQPEPPPDDHALSGTVVETMNAGGYTYAKVDRGGNQQVWVAGPETVLAVGVTLGTMQGSLMTSFYSDTLKRTFDEIYFVNELPMIGGASQNRHAAHPVTPQVTVGKIERAPGGASVAEIVAGKDALAGNPVVVRAKVVKVNNNILDRNWLHVQDGTGEPGANDLIVTTSATVAVGAVVVLRGKVSTNKDFGAGYRYAVLVEDASIDEH